MILKELQTSGGTGWSVVDAKSFTASNILAPVLSGHHIHKRRLSGRQQKTWSMLQNATIYHSFSKRWSETSKFESIIYDKGAWDKGAQRQYFYLENCLTSIIKVVHGSFLHTVLTKNNKRQTLHYHQSLANKLTCYLHVHQNTGECTQSWPYLTVSLCRYVYTDIHASAQPHTFTLSYDWFE